MEFTPQEYLRQMNLLMLHLPKLSFSKVPFSYSYSVVVESIGIDDSINAALAFDDDHFQAHRVSEKVTKFNQNSLMSFCMAIIID